jgi:hypothetical protein
MDDDEQVIVEFEDDAFAEAAEAGDRAPFRRADRRIGVRRGTLPIRTRSSRCPTTRGARASR